MFRVLNDFVGTGKLRVRGQVVDWWCRVMIEQRGKGHCRSLGRTNRILFRGTVAQFGRMVSDGSRMVLQRAEICQTFREVGLY